MADNLTITSSYAGELALPYIAAAVLSGDTIANNYITVKENVKFKAVLKVLASSGLVKAATCDFNNSTSALTLTEKVLTVTDLMVNIQLCKAEFTKDWEAAQTGRGFINDVVPANFSDFLISHLAAKVAQEIEVTIWQGGEFDGFQELLLADGGFDVDFATALTAGNVIAKLQECTDALPATLVGSPDLKIYVNRKTAQLYRQALAAAGYLMTYQGTTQFPLTFNGYDVYVCPGISDNTAILATVANLVFGTDLNSDFNEVKVVDMSFTDASDNVRMAMRFRAGVQFAVRGDIIIAVID
jgi:hypothetical protein